MLTVFACEDICGWLLYTGDGCVFFVFSVFFGNDFDKLSIIPSLSSSFSTFFLSTICRLLLFGVCLLFFMNVGVRFSSLRISSGIGKIILCFIFSATLYGVEFSLPLISDVEYLLFSVVGSNLFLGLRFPLAILHGDRCWSRSSVLLSGGSNATLSSLIEGCVAPRMLLSVLKVIGINSSVFILIISSSSIPSINGISSALAREMDSLLS